MGSAKKKTLFVYTKAYIWKKIFTNGFSGITLYFPCTTLHAPIPGSNYVNMFQYLGVIMEYLA